MLRSSHKDVQDLQVNMVAIQKVQKYLSSVICRLTGLAHNYAADIASLT